MVVEVADDKYPKRQIIIVKQIHKNTTTPILHTRNYKFWGTQKDTHDADLHC